jgi:hypothetical protein
MTKQIREGVNGPSAVMITTGTQSKTTRAVKNSSINQRDNKGRNPQDYG